MSDKPISVYHHGVEISYDTESDVWKYELDGVVRNSATLTAAKHGIDHPPKKRGGAKFKRIKVWFWNLHGQGDRQLVELTSFEKKKYSGGYEGWISGVKTYRAPNTRCKESLTHLYLDTDDNKLKFKQFDEREKEIAALNELNNKLVASMKTVKAPDGLED